MARETGRVNSNKEALVFVRLGGGVAIECIVDTGFNGALMLPRAFISQVEILMIGESRFGMVGGATMSAEIGLTGIRWLGELRQVEVIVSEDEDALIGTELLTTSILIIDYSSSTVAISKYDDAAA
jgi:clan AA aspartic protease